jgi:hypothetical protein
MLVFSTARRMQFCDTADWKSALRQRAAAARNLILAIVNKKRHHLRA